MLDRALYFSTLGCVAYLSATLAPEEHVFLYVCGYIFAHTCFYRIAVAELFDANGAVRGLKILAAHPVQLAADVGCVLLIAQVAIYLTVTTVDGDAQYAVVLGYMLLPAMAYNKIRKVIFTENT